MEKRQELFSYQKNEAARLIFDFETNESVDLSLIEHLMKNATDGLKQMGVEYVILKSSNNEVIKIAADIVKNRGIKLICQLPYFKGEELENVILKKSKKDLLILSIEEPIDYERFRAIFKNFRRNFASIENKENIVTSFILPVSTQNYEDIMIIAKELYNQTGVSVILEPMIWIHNKDPRAISWQQLDALYQQVILFHHEIGRHYAILMGQGILPTRLLTEHPCNGYVCKGSSCHSNKSDIPRKLAVNLMGELFPEHIAVDKKFLIGDLKKGKITDIIDKYYESDNHRRFRSLVKYIFINYVQVCSYRVVPWKDLFAELSKEIMEGGENYDR
ncbi:MAG TPA: hypothetical protein PK723_01335 [Candidatus Pacearchaeota archaeon]|jgi:hypothetical protein|nr:hypothetical protein [Candidatus Pacearchaeota archaeon]